MRFQLNLCVLTQPNVYLFIYIMYQSRLSSYSTFSFHVYFSVSMLIILVCFSFSSFYEEFRFIWLNRFNTMFQMFIEWACKSRCWNFRQRTIYILISPGTPYTLTFFSQFLSDSSVSLMFCLCGISCSRESFIYALNPFMMRWRKWNH